MKHTITNAAEITILEPLDNNYKTGGGPVSVGGCVLVASRGKPFMPLEILPESTWSGGTSSLERVLGTPLSKKAYGMEGLRHLAEACKECDWVNVVRAVNTKDYRYPALAFQLFNDLKSPWTSGKNYAAGDVITGTDGGKWICMEAHAASDANKPGAKTGEWMAFTGPVEKSGHRYDEEVLVGNDGYWMVFYPVDGCDCSKRTFRIEDVDTERQRFTVSIYEKDDVGYSSGHSLMFIGEDDEQSMVEYILADDYMELKAAATR